MYYGKLESDELATIKLRRYWVNILSPRNSPTVQCDATPTHSHATSKLPFSSFKSSRFQNEANCKTFLLKMSCLA